MNNKKDDFITVWKLGPSERDELVFYIKGACTIDWGDGTPVYHKPAETGRAVSFNTLVKHKYLTGGKHKEYTVRISGNITCFSLNVSHVDHKLIEIKQWGSAKWETMYGMFSGACNMVCNATDTPNTSKVETMAFMFFNCKKFNSPIEHWDTKRVFDMNYMLSNAERFNQPLAKMDISSVQFVDCMLENASEFDQDLRPFASAVRPKTPTDKLFGSFKSLAQYNGERIEKDLALDEKQGVHQVLGL